MIRSLVFHLLILLLAVFPCKAQLKSVMVNACGTEGENEYLVLENQRSSFVFGPDSICLWYGTSLPATTPVCDSFCTSPNTAYIDALNARLDTHCAFRFRPVYFGDTLHSGRYVLIMYPAPSDTPSLSAWCTQATDSIYVLFACTNKWKRAGNFANNPTSWRYLRLKFCSDTSDYGYQNGWSSNQNGNFVYFDSSGFSPSYGQYSACEPDDALALPVELLYFRGKRNSAAVELEWATASEWENRGFLVEYSADTRNWQKRAWIEAAGYSQELKFYRWVDESASEQAGYYRLSDLAFDGQRNLLRDLYLESVSRAELSVQYLPGADVVEICQSDQTPPTEYTLELLNISGSVLQSRKLNGRFCQSVDLDGLQRGIYILRWYGHTGSGHFRFLK